LLAPLLADIVAVGVPPATFTNANLADCVEVDPSNKSSVINAGANAPRFLCHQPWVPVVCVDCILPEQVKFPLLLVTVHPVAPDPPAILTSTLPSSCRLRPVLVAVNVPPFAYVREVAVTPIVSILATPVNAPPVVTLRPPLLVNANVPVELPIAVLAVPVVLMLVVPTTVNPPLAVNNPVEVRVPADVKLDPTAVRDVTPPAEITTLPVDDDPSVNV